MNTPINRSEPMPLNDVVTQLGYLRDNSNEQLNEEPEEIWLADVVACETAIKVLAALIGEGYDSLDSVLDILDDYRKLAKQYKVLYQKYETRCKPIHEDGVWHCPACNGRVRINNAHCHRCGKKLGWGR